MAITQADIDALALSPKRARTDEGSVEERSVDDLIKAQQASASAVPEYVPWGIRIARHRSGGTVDPR